MNTRNQDALHALQHVLGKDKKAIFMSLLLIFTLGLATNALYEILTGLPTLTDSPSLIIIPFLVLFWHAYRQYNEAVQQWKVVQPKILVMFLSPVNEHYLKPEDKQFLQDLITGDQPANLQTAIEKLDLSPWVMPLVAIKKHLGGLKEVIVIPSADPKDTDKGTYRQLENFQKLLYQTCGPNLKVTGIHEILKEYPNGVDFEDIVQLCRVLKGMYQVLNLQDPKELLIDITGGQKTNTVAGILFRQAEGEDCQYQYVSTHNKEVIPF